MDLAMHQASDVTHDRRRAGYSAVPRRLEARGSVASMAPVAGLPGATETPSSMAGILPKRWLSSGRLLTWLVGLAKRWR